MISVVEGVWGRHWGEVLSLMLHQCVVDCIVVGVPLRRNREDAARLNPDQRQQRWTSLQMTIRVTSPGHSGVRHKCVV